MPEPDVIVYGDFSCPYSYLASLRVDTLLAAGRVDNVEWRAVEHAPGLPVVGRRLDEAGQAEFATELREVRALAGEGERLPEAAPPFLPKTDAAIAGYAEAFGAGVGHEARRVLFDAYWVRGLDIGNVEVLRRLLAPVIRRGSSSAFALRNAGFAVSMSRAPITVSAYRRVNNWRTAWKVTGTQTMPTIAGPRPIAGVDALAKLALRPLGALDPQSNTPAASAA